MLKNFKKKIAAKSAVAAAGALALVSQGAMAQTTPGIDLSSITGAFSASDVIPAVLAIAAVLAAIYATMLAARMAIAWIRGGK